MIDPFKDAACVGRAWWPWKGTRTDEAGKWEAAQQVCAGCPCRNPCASLALSQPVPEGIWAGVKLTEWKMPENRKKLRAVLAS